MAICPLVFVNCIVFLVAFSSCACCYDLMYNVLYDLIFLHSVTSAVMYPEAPPIYRTMHECAGKLSIYCNSLVVFMLCTSAVQEMHSQFSYINNMRPNFWFYIQHSFSFLINWKLFAVYQSWVVKSSREENMHDFAGMKLIGSKSEGLGRRTLVYSQLKI